MQVPLVFRRLVPVSTLETALSRRIPGYRFAFSERLAALVVVDGLLILAAFWLANMLTPTASHALTAGEWWFWSCMLVASWWVVAWLYDLYDIPSLSRWKLPALRLTFAGVTCVTLFLLISSLSPAVAANGQLRLGGLASLGLIAGWRAAYLVITKITFSAHRTLIVGHGKRAQLAADMIKQNASLNYRLLGFVDQTAGSSERLRDGLPVWNDLAALPRLAEEHRVHEIIVATETQVDRQLASSLIACQANGLQVVGLPELWERHHRNIPIEHIDPQWALSAGRSAPTLLQRALKRLLDLAMVLMAMPLVLIVIPLVAIAIKLDSPGPVFYRQVRMGRAGKPFEILKFRSMYVDAEKDGKAKWATKNDPRITRLGRFVRKSRLDELPQLLNILKGEMSIIGPRPERPEFVQQLEEQIPYYRARLLVKPGLTGWAQIQYDYTSTIEDSFTKLQYDLYYIHRWSLWLDLYILFRTISVVTQLKGM